MNTDVEVQGELSPSILWIMAIACGLCAGANYFSHPLIASIQQHFSITAAEAQLTVTFAQVSYALGLLLLVPLGDILNRQKLIPLLMLLSAVGLFISGFAINIQMLWIGTIMTGLFTTAAQILIPLSTLLTRPERTGQVVGFLMTGLFIGIIASTSLAGLLSNLYQWNLVYLVSAIALVILTMCIYPQLPYIKSINLSYLSMFRSMYNLIVEERRLLLRSLNGGFAFGSMSVLLAIMALLLSKPPHNLSDFWIGTVGLTGIIGAFFTQVAGRLSDRGFTTQLTFIGITILILSWFIIYFSTIHLSLFFIGFAVMTLSISIIHTANQNIIFKLRPSAQSRLNAIYMTLYFTGAASGSALGIYSWNHGGWFMACMTGVVLASLSAVCAIIDYFRSSHA